MTGCWMWLITEGPGSSSVNRLPRLNSFLLQQSYSARKNLWWQFACFKGMTVRNYYAWPHN